MGNECSCGGTGESPLKQMHDNELLKMPQIDMSHIETKLNTVSKKRHNGKLSIENHKSDTRAGKEDEDDENEEDEDEEEEEEEEEEEDEEEESGESTDSDEEISFFHYRKEEPESSNNSKNVRYMGNGRGGKRVDTDMNSNDSYESYLNDCVINVALILKYVKKHAKNFSLFFNERNAKEVKRLKHMVRNYPEYIVAIGVNLNVLYIGEINENDEKHGIGIIITPDQCIYIGELENDRVTGFGVYIHFTKSNYMGYWLNGKAVNYGVFHCSDRNFYNGFWLNDKQDKRGIEYINGSYLYMGHYSNGYKNGLGCFIWENSAMYIGNVKDNNFGGNGIYFFNKRIYIKNWDGDSLNGKCEIIWDDKKQFFGSYENNLKSGIGIYKWNDGRIYIGNWSENKQHGNGIFIFIKHMKEYEKYKKEDFLLLFKDSLEIKKQFAQNLFKESFFSFGESKYIFERALANCNSQWFYYFLNVMLNVNYYEVLSEYFSSLKKKEMQDFQFNCKLYEEVYSRMCAFTNAYLKERRKGGHDDVWTLDELHGEEFTEGISKEGEEKIYGYKKGAQKTYNGEDNNTPNNRSEETTTVQRNTKTENDRNYKQKKYQTNGVMSFSNEHNGNNENSDNNKNSGNNDINDNNENSGHKNEPSNDYDSYFSDIEILWKYLNSIPLSDVKESNINLMNPLFSMASSNIIIKCGEWERGKLKKWNYSSDDNEISCTYVDVEMKEKKNNDPENNELIIRKNDETVILHDNGIRHVIKKTGFSELQDNKMLAVNLLKNSNIGNGKMHQQKRKAFPKMGGKKKVENIRRKSNMLLGPNKSKKDIEFIDCKYNATEKEPWVVSKSDPDKKKKKKKKRYYVQNTANRQAKSKVIEKLKREKIIEI